MENIRQAVERAKARSDQQSAPTLAPPHTPSHAFGLGKTGDTRQEIELNPIHLQSRRLVAYDGKDPRSRPFDLLRAEVLSAMETKWK